MKIIEKTLILQGEINKFTVPKLLKDLDKSNAKILDYDDETQVVTLKQRFL